MYLRFFFRPLVLSLVLGACGGEKIDTGPVDADGDGWTADLDCNDLDPSVQPGATEVCDGVDNDCDGLIDAYAMDQATFYIDADGDGYGDASYEVRSCEAPDGYSPAGGDCDDGDAAVFPGAVEICDGVDNDCDGLADDGDPNLDAGTATTWFRDADADGYGDAADSGRIACADPSDAFDAYTIDNTDCDDASAAVNPGLTEVCGDALDNDCDGTDDGCTPTGEVPLLEVGAQLLGESSANNAGLSVAGAGDVDGDGLDDLLVGSDAGAYVVRGPARGTCGLSAADAAIRGAEAADGLGAAVAGQDLDGDGYSDLLIGAPGEGSGAGAVRVFLAPVLGNLGADAADAAWTGAAEAPLGAALAARAGGDACFGAPDAQVDGAAVGAAWWVADATVGGIEADAAGALLGAAGWERLGAAVAGPEDVNGDGVGDWLIGAPDAGGGAGGAVLVLGPAADARLVSDADALWTGSDAASALGAAVAFAGDLTGDGYTDLAIGAPSAPLGDLISAGAVYAIAGGSAVDPTLADAFAVLTGVPGSSSGAAVAGAGDTNGDRLADLLVGGPGATDDAGEANGAAWLVLGPLSGTVGLATAARTLLGASGEAAGFAVASAGDEDGDGRADLLVGAPLNGADGPEAGAAWVVPGMGW